VLGAHLADELLHLLLGTRVEPGRRLVEQEQDGDVRSARASATFCCMPRERFSIGSPRRSFGKPTRPRISGIASFVADGRIP